jgi:murein endopeptidase
LMVKVQRLFVKTNLKIQVCRTYSTIIKDRLHRVGGLFSYSEIFDFELSFLG